MRARYYNIDIKRFINQDVVIGSIDSSTSLNRYAYVEGNPVSYLDPFGLEPYDTTSMHLAAMTLGVLAGKLTESGFGAVGACLSAFANGFDLGLTLYDTFYDILDMNLGDILIDIGNIALDIIGIVTLGLSTAAINDAKFIANVERRFTGYEHLLSMKYSELVHLGDIAGKSSVITNVFSYIVEKGEVIREKLKEIFYAN